MIVCGMPCCDVSEFVITTYNRSLVPTVTVMLKTTVGGFFDIAVLAAPPQQRAVRRTLGVPLLTPSIWTSFVAHEICTPTNLVRTIYVILKPLSFLRVVETGGVHARQEHHTPRPEGGESAHFEHGVSRLGQWVALAFTPSREHSRHGVEIFVDWIVALEHVVQLPVGHALATLVCVAACGTLSLSMAGFF